MLKKEIKEVISVFSLNKDEGEAPTSEVETNVDNNPKPEENKGGNKEEENMEDNPKEEEKKSEKETSSNKNKCTKAELINQLKDLQEDYDILNSQIQEKDQKIKDLEIALESYKTKGGKSSSEIESLTNTLSQVVEDMKAKLPENFKNLVPEGDIKSQYSWLQKALANVETEKKDNPNVEIGKPFNYGGKGEDNSDDDGGNYLAKYFSKKRKNK